MALTYDSIASTTLGTSAATISFSSIPSTYTDLKIIMILRSDRAGGATADALRATVNGSGAISTGVFLCLNNTTVSGGSYGVSWLFNAAGTIGTTAMPMPCATQAAGIFGLIEIDIMNYSSTLTNKSVIANCASDYNGSGNIVRSVHLIDTTSAITSLDFGSANGNNFVAGSVATLYGISKA